MKIIAQLLIASFTVTTLATPCNDSLFLQLKEKASDSLSQPEFFYVLEKSRQCVAYNDSLAEARQDSVEQIEKDRRWRTTAKPLIIAGICAAVVVTVVLVVSFVESIKSGEEWQIGNTSL